MSALSKLIRPDLQEFKPYNAGKRTLIRESLQFNLNESPFPQEYAGMQLNRYPEHQQDPELLRCLSDIYGIGTEQVGLFRGSDEAIDLLVRLFCRASQDAILQCFPTFGMYQIYAKLQGAKVITVPLNAEFKVDKNRLKAAWTPEVKIIFLCSPNNPSGTSIDAEDIFDLCDAYQGKSLIVVDEAYIEFSSYPSLSSSLSRYPNLAILRTLSKAYGLAGIRLGALLGSAELLSLVKAILAPYPLPTPSTEIALKALSWENRPKYTKHIQMIQAEREWLFQAISTLPFVQKRWKSDANFLLIQVRDTQKLVEHSARVGILLRQISDGYVRLSIGTQEENRRLLKVWEGFP